MTSNLLSAVKWQHYPIGSTAAVGRINLSVGEIGRGTGPTALVTAGVHGDEGPWGAWAIRKLLENLQPDELLGTLRIVPVANPLAMEADARNAPLDVLDLNRVFPGSPDGSHTERLAAVIVEHAFKGADVVIDLHGGGSWCVNSFAFQFEGGEDLAQAFHAPFIVTGPDRNITLTGYARSQGARVAAIEQGGRSEFEESWAERIAAGLRRALGVAGVLTPIIEDIILKPSIEVKPSKVLRPSSGGVFIPKVGASAVGTIVPGGTVLGHLLDPVTQAVVETFEAPFERTAMMLLRPFVARIEGGAMTYVVAEPMS